jgi:hemerythrin
MMTKLAWNKKIETGIRLIDNQHIELIRRIDALDVAIFKGTGRTELVKMLEYLASYVNEHFEAEEEMMIKVNYPDLGKHREEHKKFIAIYERILQEYKAKGADNYLALELDRQVRKWFEHHLMVTDAAYVPYCRDYRPDRTGSE